MDLNELVDEAELTEILRERAYKEADRIFFEVVRDFMRQHAKEIAEREIEKVVADALAGEVKMDDGWGKKQAFESLQDMFRTYLASEMKNYRLKDTLEREVKRQVGALIDANVARLAAKLVAEIAGASA